VDTEEDEIGFVGADEPGPRLTQTLAEQAEQARLRRRRIVGIGIVLVGVAVAIAAFTGAAGGKKKKDDAASKPGAKAVTTTTATTVAVTTPNGKTVPQVTLAAQPRWPSEIQGRPVAFGGTKADPAAAKTTGLEDGFYLWEGFDGWHVWEIGGGADDRITITADSEIAKADGIGGTVAVDKAGNHFTFSRGSAAGKVVGVEFNPGYYANTIVVSVEGKLRVHVGPHRWVRPNYYGIQRSVASR
jgi:hypothetical protein